MKMTKKIMSLAIVFAMVMAMSVTAFAANASITITDGEYEGTETGETFKAYKIFDASYAGEGNVTGETNVVYTMASTNPFKALIETFKVDDKAVFTLTASATNPNVFVVTKNVDYDAAKLAEHIKSAIPTQEDGKSTYDKETGKYTLTGLDKGYYIITDTLGSALVVETLGSAEIETKNAYPSMTKKIVDGQARVDSITADLGATVTFEITVSIPATAVGAITVHDNLDDDMTYVSVDNTVTAQEKSCTDTCVKEFVISADTVAANKGQNFTFQYTAKLNKDAETATAQPNVAWLTYSNFTSVTDTVNVYTYEFDILKHNSSNEALEGASFVLKKTVGETTYYYKWDDTNGVTWVAAKSDATVKTSDAQGKVNFKGLANGTYALEETVAPDGYNILTADKEVVINNANQTGATQVTVLNKSGTELPSTGGIGTTIFYALGGLMAVGAGVLLVAKKRMEA